MEQRRKSVLLKEGWVKVVKILLRQGVSALISLRNLLLWVTVAEKN